MRNGGKPLGRASFQRRPSCGRNSQPPCRPAVYKCGSSLNLRTHELRKGISKGYTFLSLPTGEQIPVQGRKHAVQLDAMMASLGFYAIFLGSATRYDEILARLPICIIGVMVTSLPSKQMLWVRIPYGAPAETRQQIFFHFDYYGYAKKHGVGSRKISVSSNALLV